jgi:hypothetical protein
VLPGLPDRELGDVGKLALVALALVSLAACGGGDGETGVASPEDVLTCLVDTHGLRAGIAPTPAAVDATATIDVAVNGSPDPTNDVLTLNFFPDAEKASFYLEFAPESSNHQGVSDTVTASYSPTGGLSGPPELVHVKDCLS